MDADFGLQKSKPISTLESKKLSPCRNILFSSNKKCLNPLPGAPYKGSIKQQSLSDEQKSSRKSILGQRVMSAKMLRFKQLQNQLADAHYHLNELANENRLLKALQKRQDSALRRYEGTNAELPRLINSHHEELRVLQTKYKKLKELHKDTCNILKEKENELYTVNSQNKHLLQLSKDRHLEEREKLQIQLSDMNHKMQQQQDTIQLLHRKLALETKSLKHQLHVEICKHKETQKNLQEKIEKLKSLECLLDNREKRLYYNGQLPINTKERNLVSHSLTSLKNTSISNSVKTSSRSKKGEHDMSKNNLLSYDTLESNDEEKVAQATNNDHSVHQLKSETMASLQQIRKFRLQRSPNVRKNARSMDDLRSKFKDLEKETQDNENFLSVDYKTMLERDESNNDKNESSKLRKLFSRIKNHKSQKFEKDLRDEFEYSSDDRESGNASKHHIKSYIPDIAQKSRDLYARLISSTDDTSDTLDDTMKRDGFHYNNDENDEQELNTRLAKDFQEHVYKRKPKILHHRITDLYDSGSEGDSEEKVDTNRDSSAECKTNDFPILPKYDKENSSKSIDDANHIDNNNPGIEERFIIERLKGAELQRISNNVLDNAHSSENLEVPQHSSNAKKIWLEDRRPSERNEDKSLPTVSKKDTRDEARYSEDELAIHADMSHGKIHNDTLKQNRHKEIKDLPNIEREDEDEGKTQQIRRKNSMINHPEYDNTTHDLGKEYYTVKNKETLNLTQQSSDEETAKKNDTSTGTETSLNVSSEAKDVGTLLSNNVLASHHLSERNDDATKTDVTDTKETNDRKKITYNKEKLLATMKAIDDNENIEFLSQEYKNHNAMNRMQITENLYRGLPTHSKTKRDIIKNIFEDNHRENKVRGNCSKSH